MFGKRKIRVVIDEMSNFQLLGGPGGFWLDALLEHRKRGLECTMLDQRLDKELGDDLLQACNRIVIYRCAYQTARKMAEEACKPDLWRVHHTDESVKQLHDGYDEFEKTTETNSENENESMGVHGETETVSQGRGRGKSVSKSTDSRARYRELVERKESFMSSDDQITELCNFIRSLKVGERLVIEQNELTFERVELISVCYDDEILTKVSVGED